jgi:hypothetical protein
MTPQLAIGLFIMIAGILMGLERLHVLDPIGVFRLWPSLLVATGGAMLVTRNDRKGRFWGWTLLLLGGWLLLNTLGIIRVGFWALFWPLVLVYLGVKIVTQAMSAGGGTGSTSGGNLVAIMGEAKRANTDKPFRGTQMTAIMGGCQLDLRQAVLGPGEEASVDVLAVMGGHEIWVPTGWAVISDIVPIMGGVEDKRLSPLPAATATSDAPPKLVLRGYLVMGGLTIKN